MAFGRSSDDLGLELCDEIDEDCVGLITPDSSSLFLPNEKHQQCQDTLLRTRRKQHLVAVACSAAQALKALLWCLLPSFITDQWRGSSHDALSQTQPLRPTAYLDGLRGVAAWTVFNNHLSAVVSKNLGGGWGHGGRDYDLYRLPGITLLYAGAFPVALFFVISGYALSISPLREMNKPSTESDPAAAMGKLASAAFRRPFRLYLPAIASTCLVFVLVRLSYFHDLKARLPQFAELVHGWEPLQHHWPERLDSFWAQLRDLAAVDARLFHIFEPLTFIQNQNRYNLPMWTIVLEFRASLVLFLTQMVLFFIQPRARSAILMALVAVAIAVQSYDVPLFWAGMLIAQLSGDTPLTSATTNSTARNLCTQASWWLLLATGLYLGSYPEWAANNTPIYVWMYNCTPFGFEPDFRFWTGIGAVMTLLAISRVSLLRRLYCLSLIQYLGSISFSFYLVHNAIVQALGELVFYNVWTLTGQASMLAIASGYVFSYLILLSFTICCADLFWRAIDKPSVALAFKLQRLLFRSI